jgi:hypothetical protein
MAWLFGIIGAVAAVVYWRYTAYIDPAFRLADFSTVVTDGLIYAAAGFVLGWFVGFVLKKVGPEE